jgi:hypothetical protein
MRRNGRQRAAFRKSRENVKKGVDKGKGAWYISKALEGTGKREQEAERKPKKIEKKA